MITDSAAIQLFRTTTARLSSPRGRDQPRIRVELFLRRQHHRAHRGPSERYVHPHVVPMPPAVELHDEHQRPLEPLEAQEGVRDDVIVGAVSVRSAHRDVADAVAGAEPS